MTPRVYLDHAATTPVDPRVAEAMLPYVTGAFGNPSSMHWAGREARASVADARCRVVALIKADPSEIVFTASGTEPTIWRYWARSKRPASSAATS